MKKLKTICTMTLAGLALLPAEINAQAEDDILHTDERLLTEERRQMQVRRRMSTVMRRMAWLLEDLASNQLTDSTGRRSPLRNRPPPSKPISIPRTGSGSTSTG